jgi:hypothetical protein
VRLAPLSLPAAFDQVMAIEHRMDGAFICKAHIAHQAPHQRLPDVARPPQCGFSCFNRTIICSTRSGSRLG